LVTLRLISSFNFKQSVDKKSLNLLLKTVQMTSDTLFPKFTFQQSLSSIFQWMPTCALIIDINGNIQEVNRLAIQFFRASTKEDFIFDKQNIKNMVIDRHRAVELIDLICRNTEPVNKEILIRRFDKTIASADMNAGLLPDNPNFILIQFTETFSQSQTILSELSEAFRREVQRLKPYLNKPGKELLEAIIIANLLDGITTNKPTRNEQLLIVGEDRINQISKIFPQLSNSELIICGYLSLRMSIDNVANVTGKTSNSLRVAFHRILRKTDLSSGKELLKLLETVG